jgi:SOS-response transcriptional repressor LexA
MKQKEIAAAIGVGKTYLSQLVNGREVSDKILKAIVLLERDKVSQGKTLSEEESNARITAYEHPILRRIPVISWARAGAWFDAGTSSNYGDLEGQIEEHVHHKTKDPNAYALIVEGDSMEPRYCAGDIIIAAPNYEPRSGGLVVAREAESGQVYFKKFRRKGPDGNIIELTSLNPDYKPIELPASAFRIIHPVVGVEMKEFR